MKPRRRVVSVSLAAVGVLGLSACSSETPSGLAPFTPSARTGSPSASPSPTISSKWTAEQQQVIAGYGRYNALMARFRAKTEKIDMAKAHQVGQEPFITKQLQQMAVALSAGFVDTGEAARDTTLSVTVVGSTATLNTCLDQTRTKSVNHTNPSAPVGSPPPPARVNVSLVRDAGSWLVAGLKDGGGACVSG